MTKTDQQLISERYHLMYENANAINEFAAKAHEEWRAGLNKQNGNVVIPRIKENPDGTEGDINVPFSELHPHWKKENLAAGKAAFDAVTKFPNDVDQAAEHIHNEWMKRNSKTEKNAAQHVPYDQLPESEKEKDRAHVQVMKQIISSIV